ncbi:MAG: amidohydrolase family protein [Chloroflexi bacterium]|nr:amidohydrolase family protein [Chloroflexota bacterium]
MTNGTLPVIDAHAHVGVQQLQDHMPGYWPEGKNGQSEADMLACMDGTGVDYAVLHTCNIWGMKYAARMVREHGDRFIAVIKVEGGEAHLPPQLATIQRHVEDEGFKGLYYDPWPPSDDAFANFHAQKFWPVWELVDQMKLPVCTVSYGTDSPDHFQALIKLMDAWPDLTITVVHGLYVGMKAPEGLIDGDGRVTFDQGIIDLVRNYDVNLEILAGYPGAWWGPDDVVLRALYDTFGPRKLIWGSEFTKANALTQEQARSPAYYAHQVNYLRDRCPYIPPEDRGWIMGGNTARIYGI